MRKNIILSVILALSFILFLCDKDPSGPEGLQFSPLLLTPANGAIDISLTDTLTWTCDVPQGMVVTYIVYADTGDTVSVEPTTEKGTTSNSFFVIEELYPNTSYLWRVGVTDGKDTSYSETRKFTTGKLNLVLLSPADSATDLDTNVLVSWSCQIPKRVQINYIVYADSGLTTPVTVQGITLDTFLTIRGLKYDAEYSWRVGADVDIDTTYSNIRRFTTKSKDSVLITLGAIGSMGVDTMTIITGTITAFPAIDETALNITITYVATGEDASVHFTQTGPSNIDPKNEIDIANDLWLAFTPESTITTGTYRLTISATAGNTTGSDYEDFTVTTVTPITEKQVTLGAAASAHGASLDADIGSVYITADLRGNAALQATVDVYFVFTAQAEAKLGSPSWANTNGWGPESGGSWLSAPATEFIKLTADYSAIQSQEEIDALWSGTPASNLVVAANDVVVVKTSTGTYGAIQVVSVPTSTSGEAVLNVKIKQ